MVLNRVSNFYLHLITAEPFVNFCIRIFAFVDYLYKFTPLNFMATEIVRSMFLKGILSAILGGMVLTSLGFVIMQVLELTFIPQLGNFYVTVYHLKLKLLSLISSPITNFNIYLKQFMHLNTLNTFHIEINKDLDEKFLVVEEKDSFNAKKDFYMGVAIVLTFLLSVEMASSVFVTLIDCMKRGGTF